MEQIKNYNCYTERMFKTLDDKCWWLKHIGEDIQTIIDFGCADASMIEYIEKTYPERFSFIGIENDASMLERARKRMPGSTRFRFVDKIENVNPKWYDADKTIFVMNSVLHEIYSYLPVMDQEAFFNAVGALNPLYIAIRDMHAITLKEDQKHRVFEMIAKILASDKKELFKEWSALGQHPITDINFPVEFLLKYFYTENWEREKAEQYLWNWKSSVSFSFKYFNYDVIYEQPYSIEFLKDKWKKDFELYVAEPTHLKMLFSRNN